MNEPTTVGLSKEGHEKLKRLKEDGVFGDMMDAYKFAVALALANGIESGADAQRGTIFNVGSIDPDRSLYWSVLSLLTKIEEPIYKTVEKLADWGVEEMWALKESGSLSISSLLSDVEQSTAK